MSQCERLLDRLQRGPITPIEAWKDASEIDKRLDGYAISSNGRIKSLERKVKHFRGGLKIVHERILKEGRTPSGYSNICLGDRGTYLIHRLVALAFIENEFDKPCVNHIDGNKNNNNASNLEWCTFSENEKHSYQILNKRPVKSGSGKFGELSHSSKPVAAISSHGEIVFAWGGASEAARLLNSSQGHISGICRGDRPTTFDFSLKYISRDEYKIAKQTVSVANRFGESCRVARYSLEK